MKRISSNNGRSRGDQRGSVIVELALMLPLMTIFILGAIDMGLVIREHQVLQNAAREGARFSAQPANHIDSSNPTATANSIRNEVINYLSRENITIPSVNCTEDSPGSKTWTCGTVKISQVSPIVTVVGGTTFTDFGSAVTVTYTRSFLLPGGSVLKFNSVSLNGRSVFRNLYGG